MVLDVAAATLPRKSGSVDRLVRLAETDMAGVNRLITDRMQSDVPIIPALAEHLIAAGGKRLRPLLTVAAARLAGSDNDNCLKLAAAVEFIHTATLLHDDVVDGSQLRRGKVAAHLIWGAAQSVLVGDFLFARAFELMVETNSMKALEILARASRVIAEGEVMQLMRSHDLNLSQVLYLEIIQAKTAELFAAASEAGAVSAGVDAARTDALKAYGLNLGLAFQLVDDALDYGGATETLGKNAGRNERWPAAAARWPCLRGSRRPRSCPGSRSRRHSRARHPPAGTPGPGSGHRPSTRRSWPRRRRPTPRRPRRPRRTARPSWPG